MENLNLVSNLAGSIQLAIAPVFLLAGIAGFLNVMSSRLARTVDRARRVEKKILNINDSSELKSNREELSETWYRVKLINYSVWLCTAAAVLVCCLVMSLFVGVFWRLDLDGLVVLLFVLSMLMLMASLMLFLKEVQLATRVFAIASKAAKNET